MSRLTALLTNLPSGLSKDAKGVGALSVSFASGATFIVKDGVFKSVPSSGAALNIPLNGIDSKTGTGLKFDGSDDYVDVLAGASLDIVGSITLTMWLKIPAPTSAWAGLIFKSNGVNQGYDVVMDGSGTGLRMDVYNGATYADLIWAGNIADGLWHHVAFLYDGVSGFIRIYNGGAEVANINAGLGYVSVTSQHLNIGRDPSGGRNFGGTMLDSRIYARVLTPTEIAALAAGTEPASTELRARWRLDEIAGTTARDASGNANTGTLTNFNFNATDGWVTLTTGVPDIAGQIRGISLSTLASAINATANYNANVLGGLGAVRAYALIEGTYVAPGGVAVAIPYFTSPNWQLLAPQGVVLDVLDSDWNEAQKQTDLRRAGGVWLDRIGLVYGLPRTANEVDARYARRLAASAIAAKCNGYAISNIILAALGATAVVADTGPAAFSATIEINLSAGNPYDTTALNNLLNTYKAFGTAPTLVLRGAATESDTSNTNTDSLITGTLTGFGEFGGPEWATRESGL